MSKEAEDLNLDEQFTGEHFHEHRVCGTPGKVTASLMEALSEESRENIHFQLLRVLKDTGLEDLLGVLKNNPYDKEDGRDALAYLLCIKSTEKDNYYYSHEDRRYRPPLEHEISVGLPAQRALIEGREGSSHCCDLIEKLLGSIVIEGLEKLIIHGVGEPTTQPRGLLLQLCDENKEGEAVVDVISRFRDANKGNLDAIVVSKEDWERLKQKIGSENFTDGEKRQILCGERPTEVQISSQMPENTGAIINRERVYLAVRKSKDMNNWWNYKESLFAEIYWKYRYACNLVVEHPAAAMKLNIDSLK